MRDLSVSPQALLVTGATGFIGQRLMARMDPADYSRIRCLTRRTPPDPGDNRFPPQVEWVHGTLNGADACADAFSGIDCVVHLAAVTGQARRDEYFRVNVDGTQALLEHCKRADVSRFLYVSSIAAGFREASAYHYAHSKARAEEAVRDSGLDYIIVRPTMVFGRGSAVWHNVMRLATGALTPLFGDGRVKVQPVYVDDLADCLLALAGAARPANRTIDVGGPDVLTFEQLLRRIHQASRARDARVIHLPVRPLIATLAVLERLGVTALPVTAGQLAAFVNDSLARPDPDVARHVERMTTIDEMLRLLVPHA